jgi:hypothetical protein
MPHAMGIVASREENTMPASASKAEEHASEGSSVGVPMTSVRVPLPDTKSMLYYAGLGGMTALNVIEWPVTLAVAAGYALATHDHRKTGTH